MPKPRIFVSSTFYDLKYIRENIKFFIKNLGYDPVLSEEGNVFYDPNLHVQDACIAEVPSCQILVLIIGGRYGGLFKETEKSVTNTEYIEAVKLKIPIFALVEQGVHEQFHVYNHNLENQHVNADKISYPSVDSHKIFEFIREVQGQAVNNALVPFSDFEDIQNYLKQQWASMFYRFLTSETESRRVSDLFENIANATNKIEFLTRQVINSVADPITKLNVDFYDYLLGKGVIHDLTSWNLKTSPINIIRKNSIDDFCNHKIEVYDEDDYSLIHGGPPFRLSERRYSRDAEQYREIRQFLLDKLKEANITPETFIERIEKESNENILSQIPTSNGNELDEAQVS